MKDIKEQCTTVLQSKKLVELGFTKDSASLMWENFSRIGRDIDERLWAIEFAGGMHPVTTHLKLPCWTCTDMMEIIESFIASKNYEPIVNILPNGVVNIMYGESDGEWFGNDLFRDNLFDCLVWLKTNKYL